MRATPSGEDRYAADRGWVCEPGVEPLLFGEIDEPLYVFTENKQLVDVTSEGVGDPLTERLARMNVASDDLRNGRGNTAGGGCEVGVRSTSTRDLGGKLGVNRRMTWRGHRIS
ncbi:MAG: hypothetical protein M3445_08615 [Actinomycetota bacterium]|nr:hypothetical protein [Actinomycetota bacterium]